MKTLSLSILLAAGAVGAGLNRASARADEFRTDINPALRYYQGYLLSKGISQADTDYLTTNDWRGQKLTGHFKTAIAAHNNEFKAYQQAAQAQVPCNWGVDLSEGPLALLPGLAPAKGAAQIARLRILSELQSGKQDDARNDLLATFALAHNVSQDGTLISALVQIAMEQMMIACIAENYHLFTPETLKQVADGFDLAPARGTMARSVLAERNGFYGWFVHKVQDIQSRHPGDEAGAIAEIRQVFHETMDSGGDGDTSKPGQTSTTDRILTASGGTTTGLLRLFAELPPLYDQALQIMQLPPAEFEVQIKGFNAQIQNSPNPLVKEFFPSFEKCKIKEIAVLVKLAMLRAAVEYRINGQAGFRNVADPAGRGPFDFQRVQVNGVDRGFKLTSSYAGRGTPEVLIFVEKDGAAINVDGPHAGELLKTSVIPE